MVVVGRTGKAGGQFGEGSGGLLENCGSRIYGGRRVPTALLEWISYLTLKGVLHEWGDVISEGG